MTYTIIDALGNVGGIAFLIHAAILLLRAKPSDKLNPS